MKDILNMLFSQKTLSTEQAKDVLTKIAEGKYNNSQIVAFMTAYCMRAITVDELEGFRDALLEMCQTITIEHETIDLCGTGGDEKNTFNISTLASFVVAGAGYKVAKHGNYGVSSISGSSNVVEYLGYKFTNDSSILNKQIDKAGICMLHAPLFHPAMKAVAPLRKELGVKTFFNMLGPMVNPASPQNQVVGVFSLELARLYAYLYQNTDKNFCIIHSLDGYDEISLTSRIKVFNNSREHVLEPTDLGFDKIEPNTIEGGTTIEKAAEIFVNVLENKGTKPQMNVVIANAATAINCFDQNQSFEDCKAMAIESIASGKAMNAFKNFVALSA